MMKRTAVMIAAATLACAVGATGVWAAPPEEHRAVLQAVQSLPAAYRDVVYLHYYEGYTAPEIARILGKNVNTIYTRLTRARGVLREALGGDDDA